MSMGAGSLSFIESFLGTIDMQVEGGQLMQVRNLC